MNSRKIDLEDLAEMKDGTVIDMTEVTNVVDPAYRLVAEEVENFIERPVGKLKTTKNSFSSFIPATALKESIEEVLKGRSVKEERLKKCMQFEFDRKMQRIKRIKSKTYRKLHRREKLRKEQALQIDSGDVDQSSVVDGDSSECSSNKEDSSNNGGIMNFNGRDEELSEELVDPQFGIVREAFKDSAVEGNEKEFLDEKLDVMEMDAPQMSETVLPGWDEWAGEGIQARKTAWNTVVERKDGILPFKRKDYNKCNVIINEHVILSDKYKSSLPYGYNQKEYKEQLNTPVSMETNSSRVFRRFVKVAAKEHSVLGESIKPNEFEPEY